MKKMGINGNIPVATGKASKLQELVGLPAEEVAFLESIIKPME